MIKLHSVKWLVLASLLVCTSNASAEECKPEECKPEECKPEECKPEECKPEECKPEECKPEECKPEECKPEGAALSISEDFLWVLKGRKDITEEQYSQAYELYLKFKLEYDHCVNSIGTPSAKKES